MYLYAGMFGNEISFTIFIKDENYVYLSISAYTHKFNNRAIFSKFIKIRRFVKSTFQLFPGSRLGLIEISQTACLNCQSKKKREEAEKRTWTFHDVLRKGKDEIWVWFVVVAL